jgi:phage shock protein A
MKHQPHFDTAEAAQHEAVKIRKMIGDLDRYVHLLDCDISTEEKRAAISDRSDAAYPILARMLATRRDNLKDTITALEKRLSTLDQASFVMSDVLRASNQLTGTSFPSSSSTGTSP